MFFAFRLDNCELILGFAVLRKPFWPNLSFAELCCKSRISFPLLECRADMVAGLGMATSNQLSLDVSLSALLKMVRAYKF